METNFITVGELPEFTPQGILANSSINGEANALVQYINHNCHGDISTVKENEPIFDFIPKTGLGWQSCNLIINKTHTHPITFNKIGKGYAHNNVQPYLSVYMWKRVA